MSSRPALGSTQPPVGMSPRVPYVLRGMVSVRPLTVRSLLLSSHGVSLVFHRCIAAAESCHVVAAARVVFLKRAGFEWSAVSLQRVVWSVAEGTRCRLSSCRADRWRSYARRHSAGALSSRAVTRVGSGYCWLAPGVASRGAKSRLK
jgi:hypothetical protein